MGGALHNSSCSEPRCDIIVTHCCHDERQFGHARLNGSQCEKIFSNESTIAFLSSHICVTFRKENRYGVCFVLFYIPRHFLGLTRWYFSLRKAIPVLCSRYLRMFGDDISQTIYELIIQILCKLWQNSPGTGEFPTQMTSNAENASIWWRHHVCPIVPCGHTDDGQRKQWYNRKIMNLCVRDMTASALGVV